MSLEVVLIHGGTDQVMNEEQTSAIAEPSLLLIYYQCCHAFLILEILTSGEIRKCYKIYINLFLVNSTVNHRCLIRVRLYM